MGGLLMKGGVGKVAPTPQKVVPKEEPKAQTPVEPGKVEGEKVEESDQKS